MKQDDLERIMGSLLSFLPHIFIKSTHLPTKIPLPV